MDLFYFERYADGTNPGGVTVSKRKELPGGDFIVKLSTWPDVTLWFLKDDQFSEEERELARRGVYEFPELLPLASHVEHN